MSLARHDASHEPPRDLLPWRSWAGNAPVEPGIDVLAYRLDPAPELIPEAERLLSADELDRAGRFRFAIHRNRYIAGRARVRQVLGGFIGADPSRIRLRYGPHGKPALQWPAAALSFNVAHANELALLAVARDADVDIGIDIERIDAFDELDDLAARSFSAAELEAYRACPDAERRAAFFLGWTRKESVIKATGEGLSCPLRGFDVELTPGRPARVHRAPDGDETRWSLIHLEPAPGYTGALALRYRTARARQDEPIRLWTLEMKESRY